MGKSVQANLSTGLQSLTGYRQVGAVGEVASAVVTVADTASDTVGVGDSALSEMSMFISLSGSVCPKEKSLASTACCPSWPLMPTPMCAAEEREVGEGRSLTTQRIWHNHSDDWGKTTLFRTFGKSVALHFFLAA